ncbi:MAG: phage protein GemA/Gp16 family protein [Paenibacillus dendritiformis]|uniref:phage protein GemA/Gp16 family protein n=1 Tax=uncultured Paenibacillus sp. TaxID=227322 RepID=UPI0025F5BD57|nr:phage protein GemA/Gp16 family protein [uncultured Paenibacillus sp.]MDU5141080.1 phage protein GemA/Gp16 family protein [Paenibacillus dendritiformis]
MSRAQGAAAEPKKLIWTLGRKMGLEEADIRAVLRRETGKDSMRQCSEHELRRVVLALRQLQGEQNYTGDRATKRQVWKIYQYERELGWTDNPKRLQSFLQKYYRTDRPEWLTRAQAWKAIESLKKLTTKLEG